MIKKLAIILLLLLSDNLKAQPGAGKLQVMVINSKGEKIIFSDTTRNKCKIFADSENGKIELKSSNLYTGSMKKSIIGYVTTSRPVDKLIIKKGSEKMSILLVGQPHIMFDVLIDSIVFTEGTFEIDCRNSKPDYFYEFCPDCYRINSKPQTEPVFPHGKKERKKLYDEKMQKGDSLFFKVKDFEKALEEYNVAFFLEDDDWQEIKARMGKANDAIKNQKKDFIESSRFRKSKDTLDFRIQLNRQHSKIPPKPLAEVSIKHSIGTDTTEVQHSSADNQFFFKGLPGKYIINVKWNKYEEQTHTVFLDKQNNIVDFTLGRKGDSYLNFYNGYQRPYTSFPHLIGVMLKDSSGIRSLLDSLGLINDYYMIPRFLQGAYPINMSPMHESYYLVLRKKDTSNFSVTHSKELARLRKDKRVKYAGNFIELTPFTNNSNIFTGQYRITYYGEEDEFKLLLRKYGETKLKIDISANYRTRKVLTCYVTFYELGEGANILMEELKNTPEVLDVQMTVTSSYYPN